MESLISIEKLDTFAHLFWKHLPDAKVILLHGDIGAGKTTLIAALCRAKGVIDSVSSPTFSIINEYAYKEHEVLKKLYHIDLYRLQNEEEAAQAGVEDCLYSGALCLVEWPERAPQLFDESAVHVALEPVSDTERCIRIFTDPVFHNRNAATPH